MLTFFSVGFCADSGMSIDSVGMVPTDEDCSDEEMRCALQYMEEEEERNAFSFPLYLFPTADVPFHSQSPMTEDQPSFFTEPSLVSKVSVSVSMQCASVLPS